MHPVEESFLPEPHQAQLPWFPPDHNVRTGLEIGAHLAMVGYEHLVDVRRHRFDSNLGGSRNYDGSDRQRVWTYCRDHERVHRWHDDRAPGAQRVCR